MSAVVGENGIINRATDASQKTKFASEKEAIEFIINDIKTGQMIGEEIPKDKIKGEELFTKNFENAAKWKIITETVDGKVVKKYGTNWFYLKKGTDLFGTELSKDYIVNYSTGEMVEFDEEKHKMLSYKDGDGLGYSDNLILNIDPGIMDEYNSLPEDQKKNYDIKNLGEGVELVGYNGTDGKVDLSQAFTKSSYKFDGQDDYIKINYDSKDKVKNIVENGLTFEYYGTIEPGVSKMTSTGEIRTNPAKGLLGFWNGKESTMPMVRFNVDFESTDRSFWWSPLYGTVANWDENYYEKESELYGPNMITTNGAYWNQLFNFDKNSLNNVIYLTLVVDPSEETMCSGEGYGENYNNLCIKNNLYINGEKIEGKLNKKLWKFLNSENLDYDFNSFVIGRCSFTSSNLWHYIKGDCYSLRFYDKALTDKQIQENREKTMNYHQMLESE